MLPINQLFWPTPRDQQSTLWGPRYEENNTTNNAAAITQVSDAIPQDRIFWVNGVYILASPGGAITVAALQLHVYDEVSQASIAQIAAQISSTRELNLPDMKLCLVGGVHRLAVTCTFSGSHASNDLSLSLWGLYSIRGNVALF